MPRPAPARKILPIGLLPALLLLAGCSSAVQVRLPENMVPFKDAARKMEFKLPPGWEPTPVEPVIEKSTKFIRGAAPAGFRKGDKGTLAVWCDRYDPNRSAVLHMYDVVDAYAPIHKPTEISFEVESAGAGYLSRPTVRGIRATHVEKGEKKEFLIVTAVKTPPVVKMHQECEYILIGRSTSEEYSEEIKADITAIAATLRNSGE